MWRRAGAKLPRGCGHSQGISALALREQPLTGQHPRYHQLHPICSHPCLALYLLVRLAYRTVTTIDSDALLTKLHLHSAPRPADSHLPPLQRLSAPSIGPSSAPSCALYFCFTTSHRPSIYTICNACQQQPARPGLLFRALHDAPLLLSGIASHVVPSRWASAPGNSWSVSWYRHDAGYNGHLAQALGNSILRSFWYHARLGGQHSHSSASWAHTVLPSSLVSGFDDERVF